MNVLTQVDPKVTSDERPEPLGKCMVNGEPLTVKLKVVPVDGSVEPLADGEAGSCPECGAHVKLSGKGFITSHMAQGVSVPAPRILATEPQVPATDAGPRSGSPEREEKVRASEIDALFERGTVRIPGKNAKGRTVMVDAPLTEDNIRKAFDYWRNRAPKKEASIATQRDMIARLGRQAELMRQAREAAGDTRGKRVEGRDVMGAQMSPEGVTRFAVAGPALVQGRNMGPAQPKRRNPKTGELEVSGIGTMGGNLGREKLDRMVADQRDKGRFTPSQRRNWRRKQAKLRARNGE